jgi:hypothetical protein
VQETWAPGRKKKRGLLGPKNFGSQGLMNLDLSLSVLIHGWCTGGCWVAQADTYDGAKLGCYHN